MPLHPTLARAHVGRNGMASGLAQDYSYVLLRIHELASYKPTPSFAAFTQPYQVTTLPPIRYLTPVRF
jgi:hypothetical protein